MAYYTQLYDPGTYERFSASDQRTAGFPASQRKTSEKLRPGDILVCYLTRLSRWVGALRVVDGPYEDDTPLFATENDRYTVRFHVEPIIWLPKDHSIPMREERLWSRLSFTRDLPDGSNLWTGKVRRSLVELDTPDGDHLLTELDHQNVDPTVYPVDEAWYAQLLPKTAHRPEGTVEVSIPNEDADEPQISTGAPSTIGEPRDSYKVQAKLARIGATMGYKIWLPRNDRSAVTQLWNVHPGTLLEKLPLNYNETTLATIENIDVLWVKKASIVRAFEIEHTTAVYSGILRMADLLALQPNMDIKLHIVAPIDRREKVMTEINRPVFALLEKGPLAENCTFISYDAVDEIAAQKHLAHLSNSVLDEYIEQAS